VSSRVFHQAAEDECKDIVEEPATAQANEETAHSLRAREVGALTTLVTFGRSPSEKIEDDSGTHGPACTL
jgi:hypothetical protein